MRVPLILGVAAASLLAGGFAPSVPLRAATQIQTAQPQQGLTRQGGYLQCVPYARAVTGIKIFGDAHTWWGQADGKYVRGQTPKVGAVMNFRPHGNSRLGHVAAVSRIIDSRTVLLRHANWSVRGGIEDDVRAVDVSDDNDWSRVRVWYGPGKRLGASSWPLYGFIYNEKPGRKGKAKKPSLGDAVNLIEGTGKDLPLGKRKDSAASKAKPKAQALPAALPNDPIGAIIRSGRD